MIPLVGDDRSVFIVIFQTILDVVNQSDFQSILREYCHETDAINWQPLSIVRYNSVIVNRGIIKSKGFFLYATRDVPNN